MVDRPVVTVCIPTYNRRGLLSAALTSVLGQSLRDIEVIVSDNASTDDTEEYVRRSTILECGTTGSRRTPACSRT